jgi:hypothetical protein
MTERAESIQSFVRRRGRLGVLALLCWPLILPTIACVRTDREDLEQGRGEEVQTSSVFLYTWDTTGTEALYSLDLGQSKTRMIGRHLRPLCWSSSGSVLFAASGDPLRRGLVRLTSDGSSKVWISGVTPIEAVAIPGDEAAIIVSAGDELLELHQTTGDVLRSMTIGLCRDLQSSPDGVNVLFHKADDQGGSLWLLNRSTWEVRLFPGSGAANGAWLDSNRLLITRRNGVGGSNIVYHTLVSGEEVEFADGFGPVICPHARNVAYYRRISRHGWQLVIANLEDGKEHFVFSSYDHRWEPVVSRTALAWDPEGKHLAVVVDEIDTEAQEAKSRQPSGALPSLHRLAALLTINTENWELSIVYSPGRLEPGSGATPLPPVPRPIFRVMWPAK